MDTLTERQVWELLEDVKDPEIPVVSVVEMGIVRSVEVQDGRVRVVMTPTFAGCPALRVMEAQITERLRAAGVQEVQVEISLAHAWSSERISPSGRQKLRNFGLAPPPHHAGDLEIALSELVACPYCGSTDTVLRNSFGPTLCRAIYTCTNCRQPFEQFKPV